MNWSGLVFLLWGCGTEKVEDSAVALDPLDVDDDGDGWSENQGDCDDTNARVTMPLECDDPRFDFVLLPATTFTMGAPEGQEGRDSNETIRDVTLTRSFFIQTTEMTQEIFEEWMGYNATQDNLDCGSDCPAEYITWHEAAYFTNALSDSLGFDSCYTCTGELPDVSCSSAVAGVGEDASAEFYDCTGFRLPTEAEWEYAAKGGSDAALWTENGGGEIPSGMGSSGGCPPNNTDDLILSDGTDLASLAWFCVNGNDQVHPVGQLAPNGFGLYDMGGNVREWMNDWYANTEPGAVTDPVGDGVGNGNKIRRGGSFADHSRRVRPASRLHSDPERRANMIGFRLVRTALEE